MTLKLISCKNYEDLSLKASALIFRKLNDVIITKHNAVIAFPGGRSIVGILKELKNTKTDWSKVEIFLTDERMVPIDDKGSNYKLIKDTLLTEIKLKIHHFDLRTGIQDYNTQFQKVGGHFDVIVLGVGEDGHIASLFPNHTALHEKGKKYLSIRDSPKPPPQRITASPEMIQDAGIIFLLFVSESKKKAYDKFMNRKMSYKDCPAKIALEAKEVYVLKDF
jgi:6-phosphogluconolactonase